MLETARIACHGFTVWLVLTSVRAAAWVVGGACILTALLLYYTATNLSLDTNTVNMLDPSLPFRKQQAEFERMFPQFNDLIAVVIDGNTADDAQNAADTLAAKLRADSQIFQSISQPGQGPFFARNGLLFLDTAELSKLADELAAAEPFLATLSEDPSLRGLFSIIGKALDETLSPTMKTLLTDSFERIADTTEALLAGRPYRLSWQEEMLGNAQLGGSPRRSFILAQPLLNYQSLQPGKKAIRAIRRAITELELDERHGVRVRLTGSVAMDEEDLASVSRSAKTATVLSFALVCLLLLFGLRAPRLVLWILVTLFMGLVWTAAFATATIGYLNLLSVTFAVLFIGLGVDFGIQFGMRYREELARVKNNTDALAGAAGGLCDALLLAASCAALSFFCFMPTAYRGLAQLGFIAGFSMLIALFATLVILPALLTLSPIRVQPRRRERRSLPRWRFPMRHTRAIIWATVLVAAGSAALVPQVRFDFNPLNLSDPTNESVATFRDLLKDPDTTPYTIDILAPNLAAAQKLAERLDTLEVVDKTVTLASFVPSHQEDKFGIIDDMNLFLMPVFLPGEQKAPPTAQEQVAALAQFQAKLEKLGNSPQGAFSASARRLAADLERLKAMPGWPAEVLKQLQARILSDLPKNVERLQQLLAPQRVSLADLPQDLQRDYLTSDGRARIEVYPKKDMNDNRNLREFVRTVQEIAPNAIGAPVTLVESGKAVFEACLQASLSAMLGVFVLLAVVLRKVWESLLILLPLVLAMLLTVALSVLLPLPFNFANVIAIPLLLGIGVAFGIYLVTRKAGGMSVDELFRSSTPRAVFFSGLTTMASFGTLAISRHRGMSGMGMLVTFTLTFALFAALIVLPAIMAEIDRRRERTAQRRRERAGGAREKGPAVPRSILQDPENDDGAAGP